MALTGLFDPITGDYTPSVRPIFRDPIDLYVSSPDIGLTLTVQVTIPNEIRVPEYIRIYYLSPLDVSPGQISLGTKGVYQKKLYVTDVPATSPFTVSGIVAKPTGTAGSRRDYSLGGWMFAIGASTGSGEDLSTASQPIPIPFFSAVTSPPNKTFSSIGLTSPGPDVYGVYPVTIQWNNPFPDYGTVRNAEIWMQNYMNDSTIRDCGVFLCSTVEGGQQKTTFYLEREAGTAAHNVIFYVAECNESRRRIFGKAITAHGSVAVIGGFP